MQKKLISAALLCLCFALLSCNVEKFEQENPSSMKTDKVLNGSHIESGVLNLCLSEEKAAAIEAGGKLEIDGIKIKSIKRMFPDAGELEMRHREMGLHKWYTVRYDDSVPTTKVCSQLGKIEGVEIVETVAKSRPEEVKIPFNDFYARRNQWHLYNDGSLLNGFIAGADINVLPLWEAGIVGDKKVIVAVIDTGADVNNPDLSSVLIPCGDNGSKNFLNGAAEATKYTIYPGDHGTHVAGIIAAVNNNGKGVCGIAGGKDGTGGVRILNLQTMGKIPGEENSENGSEASALVWAADHGAVIANNSWGYVYDSESSVPGNNSFSLITIHLAIDYFIKHAGCSSSGEQSEDSPMKGGLVLFAAGNNGWSKGQPGMYEKVLAVGSCGPAFEQASYTNYGSWVDICAPGGNYGSYGKNNFARICSSLKGSRYGYMQGTSMACPMVAGVAALLVSHYGGKGFTAEKLKTMLLEGANKDAEKYHARQIGPMLDARGALISQTPVPIVTDLKAKISRKSVNMEWTARKDYDKAVDSYLALISKSREKVQKYNPLSLSESDTTLIVRSQKIGETINSYFGEMEFGQYYGAVFAVRKSHQHSTVSNIVSIEVEKSWTNSPPVIKAENEGPVTLKYSDIISYNFSLSDADEDKLTVNTDGGSAAAVWNRITNSSYRLLIKGSDAPPGKYAAEISADDGYGGKASCELVYTIKKNHLPVIGCSEENGLKVAHNSTVNVFFSFSDEDDDYLVHSFTKGNSKESWQDCADGRLQLTLSPKIPDGTYTATVYLDDGNGGKVKHSFSYTIISNSPVKIIKKFENRTLNVGESVQINLGEHFADGDGDEIIYNASSSYAGVQCKINDGKLTIFADKYGIANIEISAKDADGPRVNGKFILLSSNPGKEYEIYPNPMRDRLNLATNKEADVSVKIINTNGKLIHSESWKSKPYSPKSLDVKNHKPGLYKVEFTVEGKVYEENVLKI